MKKQVRKLEVLAIEDNPADVTMIQAMMDGGSVQPNMHFCYDGEAGLDFVHRRGKYQDAPRPDLILLDLNLPRKDGREVLQEIKSIEKLKCIPILVLSTSNSQEDIHRCYELYANGYFTKPSDLREYNATMKAIEECWMRLVRLPDYPSWPAHAALS